MALLYCWASVCLMAIATAAVLFRGGSSFAIPPTIIPIRTTTTTTSSSLHVLSQPSSPSSSSPSIDCDLPGSTTVRHADYDVVSVDLNDGRDYPIYIGTNIGTRKAADLLQSHVQGKNVLIITNGRIAPWYLEKYEQLFALDSNLNVHTLILPDGEAHKNMETLNTILDRCLELKLDRQSTLVALGGGVIGDMVGFAAAIYQRGIAFIQIPTTVMAMVDSSVGGKTGVNHPLGKNMIGSFHQPNCVYVDTETLATLPDRELCSGIAEIIKYGLIRDASFLAWQEMHISDLLHRHSEALRFAITRSCQNKAAVVRADEKESAAGVRAHLNLGHTFGHAIENGSGYGTFLHGEAVAIGTAMAARLSYKMGWITEPTLDRIDGILKSAHLPVSLPPDSPMNRQTFLDLMSVDKKVSNGQLRLILLKGEVGNCVFTADFDPDALIETIDEFVVDDDSRGSRSASR